MCLYKGDGKSTIIVFDMSKCSQRISKNLFGETSLVKYGVTVMYVFVQVHCGGD